MSFVSISLAAVAAAHIGTLKSVPTTRNATAERASIAWECNLSGSHTARAELEPDSQWLTIDLGSSGDLSGEFRGIATRARYTDGGETVEAYSLSSAGSPYVYDFQLVTNQTTGAARLTLTLGADSFACATAE